MPGAPIESGSEFGPDGRSNADRDAIKVCIENVLLTRKIKFMILNFANRDG